MGPPPETAGEPSIEEILDSIRQIIADDEEGGDGAQASQKPVSPKPAEDDIIELRDRVEEPKAAPPPPPPEPVREPEPVIAKEPEPAPAPPPPPVKVQAPEPVMPPEPIDDLESVITQKA